MKFIDFLLGRRLPNREYNERRIGVFEGIPAMGLDGLGSSSYGPEAALSAMIPLGAASFALIGWIMALIIGLLIVLFASYWQTIKAYPNNGGAYTVAKANLGENASLLAAAALMVDYILNVAVGISAGVAALVSAIPWLHPYILPFCLLILLVITLVNLRGTLDAGRVFAVPTYAFVVTFAIILVIGIGKVALAGGHPNPIVTPPALPPATQAVSLWLLMRSFASGCTAMTGVEAVSNGMSAFREPRVRYGHRTLAAIVFILAALLSGIAYLVTAFRVGAMDQTHEGYRSVLSQLASAIIGNGPFYYVAMASIFSVLALSANTSFAGFPRLCRLIAEDGFLPRPFALAGRRLVFSVGILYLATAAGILLILFGGVTDRLIPLFAIGAFTTFFVSQAGMVVHWHRCARSTETSNKRQRDGLYLLINLVGALITGVATSIIIVAKFMQGAWITLVVIPLVIVLLKLIRRYYDSLAASVQEPADLVIKDIRPPLVLVTTEDWNRLTEKALQLALTLTPDVIGVHLTHLSGPEAEEQDRSLRERWHEHVEKAAIAAGLTPPRLVIIQAQYRNIYEPVLELTADLERQFGRRRVAILVPEIVKRRWYQKILHANHANYLRSQLLRYGGANITIISVPWRLDDVHSAQMV